MKVAVVAPTPVPFTRGGAERAWSGLHAALLEAGHDADVVKLPVRERTLADLAAGYRAFAALDLSHFDAIVTSKYPAWICPHPHHVLWMFHPLRGLYDTYDRFGLPLVPGPVEPALAALLAAVAGPPARAALDEVLGRVDEAVAAVGPDHFELAIPSPVARLVVRWLDRVALDPTGIARYVALSRTIAGRADYLPPGAVARVAHAPSDLVAPDADGPPPAPPGGREPGSYLFTASRLDGPKRLDLLVRAMAQVPHDIPLLIGGTGPEEGRLRDLAAGDPRIELLGFVPDEDLPGLYAGARAVPFVPDDEDYGLIAVEAMALGTPVVTCTDSGGPTELVHDGVDGLVAAPEPEALAAALRRVAGDPDGAAAMGEAARRRARRITWPAVVHTLLGRPGAASPAGPAPAALAGAPASDPRRARARTAGRPRVVVLTTFRVAERGHGGQLRAFHLYGALARHAEVEIVSLTAGGPAGSREIAPGLVETAVPRTPAHDRAADELTLALGTPMTDLVAGTAIEATPEYLRRLRDAARGADVVVLAEPYLLPALAAAGVELPFVYDAYNVEGELKADVLPATPGGDEALARIVAVETEAATRAAAITACSAEDAEALAALGQRPRADTAVVPNGTDCAALVPPTPEDRARDGERWRARAAAVDPGFAATRALAVFFGSWHPPNLAAAELLLEVAGQVPDVAFVLGGRHGDAFAGRALPPNLAFAGVVSDRAKAVLLRSAQVALNPMTFGSGTNLKIIEYLAAGVPVVSTDVGARGLEVVAGQHLLVVGADDVAAGVRAVVDDPGAAARRAAAGRALVEERYDWAQVGDRLAAVVARVAGAPVVSGPGEAVR
ncbi:MAG TPA: glycosyltransferase family 4 protein [Acidimicrobiales bacterium]|nr:glycosyltransferase family 4 protein [Acidimicrobiales bacterium]